MCIMRECQYSPKPSKWSTCANWTYPHHYSYKISFVKKKTLLTSVTLPQKVTPCITIELKICMTYHPKCFYIVIMRHASNGIVFAT
jgi:hypothetical protein